jgi:hypothetical protein
MIAATTAEGLVMNRTSVLTGRRRGSRRLCISVVFSFYPSKVIDLEGSLSILPGQDSSATIGL